MATITLPRTRIVGDPLVAPPRHKGTGRIVYDPRRPGMKSVQPWWCILEVDREITRYYRWWLQKEKHIILQQPAWDAHISIVRGEKSCQRFPELWRKYQNEQVTFDYEHGLLRSVEDKDQPGQFYWIDVECPRLSQIRDELGLPVGWRFHITIGRTYY